jgi:hypothetical protein
MVVWLVAAWAMIRMLVAGFRAGERYWLVNPKIVLASYNSTNLRIFAACIFVLIALAIAFNVLFIAGYIEN